MEYEQIPLENFSTTFGTKTELSSVALNSEVVAVSDEFFAEAFHLLQVEPAPSLKGQFGPKGALYSGWETRRHNATYDWCIIKLGGIGTIDGFDIDTSQFNGNEAPEASVQVLFWNVPGNPTSDGPEWIELLPRVKLGPNSRHLFKIPTSSRPFSHVKLNMYPDGGIARFRVYGTITPAPREDPTASFDLAHVFAGGRVVFTSDQHFGKGSNLLLPGRGKDMGDGWETKRSRALGHKDWVIIKLGEPGDLEVIEIDTAHFKGNYPESCEVHATFAESEIPSESDEWICVLARMKLGPHRRHYCQLEHEDKKIFTHVRVTIYPDGGIKRVRVIGTSAAHARQHSTRTTTHEEISNSTSVNVRPAAQALRPGPITLAVPLTPEAFAPFGKVFQAWSDPNAAPRGIKVTNANQGSALKFHKLAVLDSSYPESSGATTGISVYRCQPLDVEQGKDWSIKLLERHPYTSQAFSPLGSGGGLEISDSLGKEGRAYLVVVAKNNNNGMPDFSTLRAFVASTGQGIMYNTGVWHHPMVSLETTIDFACVETQIGNGCTEDCEIFNVEINSAYLPIVRIPKF